MFSLAYDRNGKHARALWHKLKGQEYSRIEKKRIRSCRYLSGKESQDSLKEVRSGSRAAVAGQQFSVRMNRNCNCGGGLGGRGAAV